MRLIDADPLVAISWKAHTDETYEQGFEDGVCHALDRIEQAPAVAAIPVEWLTELEYGEDAELSAAANTVLAAWLTRGEDNG